MPSILELVHQCLADEERSDAVVKLSFGLIGDLADCFPNGQIKEHLLEEWVAHEFRSKRGMQPETKKTLRWAREVRILYYPFHRRILTLRPDDQTRNCIDTSFSQTFPLHIHLISCMRSISFSHTHRFFCPSFQIAI